MFEKSTLPIDVQTSLRQLRFELKVRRIET
jgi:hypothetical protein